MDYLERIGVDAATNAFSDAKRRAGRRYGLVPRLLMKLTQAAIVLVLVVSGCGKKDNQAAAAQPAATQPAGSAAGGGYAVEKTPLEGSVGSLFTSDDGGHCAYWLIKGEKNIIVIDGKPGAEYDALVNPGLQFSPGGKHSIYVARKNGKDGKCVAVVDGKEESGNFGVFDKITFSPDGEHVAYLASAAADAPKQVVVLDGKAQREYDQILSAEDLQLSFGNNYGTTGTAKATATYCLLFSPDSKHLCYAAKSGQKSVLVCDGNEVGSYDNLNPGDLAFCPKREGKHFSYEVVVGKQANKDEMTVSPDGDHMACVTRTSGKFAVLVDDKPGSEYDQIAHVIFSPDGSRLAYSAKKGEKWLLVVDGQPGAAYDEVRDNSFLFSPDGKRFAYKARTGDKWVVVSDGKEGEKFDDFGPVAFSPDSKHLVYKAAVGKKFVEVVDGQAGAEWDGILVPAFSSDGKHMAYVAVDGKKWTTVLDSQAGQDYYDLIFPGSLKGFPDGSWAFVAANAETFCSVKYIPKP